MGFRLAVFTIFLLLSVGFALPAKNSGKTKTKKPSPPKLSSNIENNPFLQKPDVDLDTDANKTTNTNTIFTGKTKTKKPSPPKLSSNIENNPFLQKPDVDLDTDANKTTNTNTITITETADVRYLANPFLQDSTESRAPFKGPITFGTQQNRAKSDLMCEEYGKQIGSSAVLPLVGESTQIVSVNTGACRNTNPLIVGGVNANPGEFPHMVALVHKNNDGTFKIACGGSLISPEWVLTAAHCTHGPNGPPKHIRIGLHSLNEQRGIMTTIKRIVKHPNYKPPALYYDIALVKMNTSVTFSKDIRPACLYQYFHISPLNAWVTGWGVTEYSTGEDSEELQKARLNVIDNIVCATQIDDSPRIPTGIIPSMLCAGDIQGGWKKDTCQGDSGGPLQIIHPQNTCLYEIVGITSFGVGCALPQSPGVYTRVSHYLNWIEDTVWP